MSVVYEPSGIFTDAFNGLHDKLKKSIEVMVETDIKPFVAQGAACMDIRLINAEMRDLVDLYMDSLWLDCLEELRSQGVQS